jgi:hypothetical protein
VSEPVMDDPVGRLTLQLLAWIDAKPRTYAEVMDAWRSTCPRLSVWEDALSGGLVRVDRDGDAGQSRVTLTPRGRDMARG